MWTQGSTIQHLLGRNFLPTQLTEQGVPCSMLNLHKETMASVCWWLTSTQDVLGFRRSSHFIHLCYTVSVLVLYSDNDDALCQLGPKRKYKIFSPTLQTRILHTCNTADFRGWIWWRHMRILAHLAEWLHWKRNIWYKYTCSRLGIDHVLSGATWLCYFIYVD